MSTNELQVISYNTFDHISISGNPFLGGFIKYNDKVIFRKIKNYFEYIKGAEPSVKEEILITEDEWKHFQGLEKEIYPPRKLNSINECPHCNSKLVKESADQYFKYIGDTDQSESWLLKCINCNFWAIGINESDFQNFCHTSVLSSIEKYSVESSSVPMNALLHYLKKQPESLRMVNPTIFEKLVGEFLKVEWEVSEVKHVGKSHDGGIDLILITSDKEKWLVQCKRRLRSDNIETIDTVKILIGTMIQHQNLRGILVSTTDHFSNEAIRLQKSDALKKSGIVIELYDFGVLREILPKTRVQEPWLGFFEQFRP